LSEFNVSCRDISAELKPRNRRRAHVVALGKFFQRCAFGPPPPCFFLLLRRDAGHFRSGNTIRDTAKLNRNILITALEQQIGDGNACGLLTETGAGADTDTRDRQPPNTICLAGEVNGQMPGQQCALLAKFELVVFSRSQVR
jgi:hypothetical protein